jgi:hypothetical protein
VGSASATKSERVYLNVDRYNKAEAWQKDIGDSRVMGHREEIQKEKKRK